MLRYRLAYYIESKNYIFKYNTNNDRLYVIIDKKYAQEYISLAREEKAEEIYKREMIEQAISGEYEKI